MDPKQPIPAKKAAFVQLEDGRSGWEYATEADAIEVEKAIPMEAGDPTIWERRGKVMVINLDQYEAQKQSD